MNIKYAYIVGLFMLLGVSTIFGDEREDDIKKMFEYAKDDKRSELEQLLKKYENDEKFVNEKDNYGRTVLMKAVDDGHKNIVELLLKNDKVNVNEKDKDEWTALVYAVMCGRKNIVELLLKNDRVNVNEKNNVSKTALDIARSFYNKEIIDLLIEASIKPVEKFARALASIA